MLKIGETVKQTAKIIMKGSSPACLPAATAAYVGIEASQSFSKDDAVQGYALTAPYLSHSFEYKFSEKLALTVDSQIDFTLDKVAVDEATSNVMNIQSEPALQWLDNSL